MTAAHGISLAILALGMACPAFGYDQGDMPRKLGTLSAYRPAFLFLEKFAENQPLALVESSFGLFGGNAVRYIPNIASALTDLRAASFDDLTKDLKWPNDAKAVPTEMFGRAGVLVAGGFLVPGQATGAITFVDIETREHIELSTPKNGFFYHRFEWYDMNGDGRLDIVTARGNKPMFGGSKGDLLWLENPGELKSGWKEHVIGQGPDVNLRMYDIDGDGKKEIITPQFFSKKLTVWWGEGDRWTSRVVDDKIGSAFDVEITDVNNDGRLDLLATNHEASNGSVFAYEFPANFRTDPWKRHTLLTGIETLQGGMNQASPGAAVSFQPKVGGTGKPSIVVAGDGSQRAHLLTPKSEEPGNWDYAESILLNAGCTVGQPAVGDVNGDGYTEIFVPAYDKDTIHVFTYAP